MEIVTGLFLVTLAALVGGFVSRALRMPVLVGYILSGIVFSSILPSSFHNISSLAEIGTILLLFSIGVELSFDSLAEFFKIAAIGSTIQVLLITFFGFIFLNILGFSYITSLVLAMGFSVSST